MKNIVVNGITLYDFKQFYLNNEIPFSASLDNEKKQHIIKWWIWDSYCLKRAIDEIFHRKPMNKLIPDPSVS